MYFEVTQAENQGDYQIRLTFVDGSVGIVDLSSYLNPNNVFKKFYDQTYFSNFSIEFGTLVWGDGELDIAPESLYQMATGNEVILSTEQTVG